MAEDKKAKQIIKYADSLNGEKSPFLSTWEDIARYINPQRAMSMGFTKRADFTRIYSGVPIRALGLYASGLHTMLTNPAIQWFLVEPNEEKLHRNYRVMRYLQHISRIAFMTLVSSNFHSQVHESYMDLGSFGNTGLFCEPDPVFGVRFNCRPMSELCWTTDERGFVSSVVREFSRTAEALAADFGTKVLPQKVIDALNRPDAYSTRKFTVIHVIRPRRDYTPGSWVKTERPFESVYVLKDHPTILEEGGYYELPCACARHGVSPGNDYGYGLGEAVLPDAKSLHATARTMLRAAQKASDPALMLPSDVFVSPLDVSAGAVNYYKVKGFMANSGGANLVQPMPQGQNFMANDRQRELLERNVERGYFVDQLNIRDGDRMTATEVRQLVRENQRTLAPQLGRSNTELLEPVIKRTIHILERLGYFPPPPPELEGNRLRVKFISPLARSQKQAEAENLLSAMDAITPFANADPTILKGIEQPELLRFVFDAYGAPLDVVKDPEEFLREVEAVERQRAQAEAEATQMQGAQNMASAVRDVAAASKDFGQQGRVPIM